MRFLDTSVVEFRHRTDLVSFNRIFEAVSSVKGVRRG